jgi:hypothetical protein
MRAPSGYCLRIATRQPVRFSAIFADERPRPGDALIGVFGRGVWSGQAAVRFLLIIFMLLGGVVSVRASPAEALERGTAIRIP